MRFRPVVLALAACCGPTYQRMGPTVHDIPAPAPVATRAEGPLSLVAKVAETPWRERQKLMDRARHTYLDRVAIHEDSELYLKLVAEMFPHPTSERSIGITTAKHEAGLLEQLAPYTLDSTSGSYVGLYGRLPLCARPPGEMWHCFPELVIPTANKPAFEIGEAAPGVALFTIHDASGAGAWSSAFDRLASARAIVIDMRDAAGTDPRSLVPWLERLTGRAPWKPLQEIRRPKDLDAYVANYAARFLTASRDRDAWEALVGEMPVATKPATKQAIAVIVGPGCGAACELVARSLVTYANATLYGSVGAFGRLDRDEPALLVLPHSKIEVYFHATEYVLNHDIERATGPTADWHVRTRDTLPDNVVTFAARDLTTPPSARCDSLPAYSTADKIPAAILRKIPNAVTLGFCPAPASIEITIATKAPLSALTRFAQTCKEYVGIEASYGAGPVVRTRLLPVLTQLAQSDLVTRVDIRCEPPNEPN